MRKPANNARTPEGNGDLPGKPTRYVIEFVESLQPPFPREKKQVVIISTLFGCPGNCLFCDAGGDYHGKLTAGEMLAQVDYVARKRFTNGKIVTEKFKIQFARMGEPSLNPAVLEIMERLPGIYGTDALNVSLSTIAPSSAASREFFERLIDVKNRHYPDGRFQLQFSIHTTDDELRNRLMPIEKIPFEEMAAYGDRFFAPGSGDKKITLNFAQVKGYPIDPGILLEYFDPSKFLIKLTPVNPTRKARMLGLVSAIDPHDDYTSSEIIKPLRQAGFDVILSIGELEENRIGSNCGQYVQRASCDMGFTQTCSLAS